MERILRKKLKNGCFANVSPERSRIMSTIRGKSNKSTEMLLKMALVRAGVGGWISHPVDVYGKPDFFFRKKKCLAVFVDGCFWHGCPKCGHIPKTNRPFWSAKLLRNRQRDLSTSRRLRAQNITVLRIWEHDVANRLQYCVGAIKNSLSSRSNPKAFSK